MLAGTYKFCLQKVPSYHVLSTAKNHHTTTISNLVSQSNFPFHITTSQLKITHSTQPKGKFASWSLQYCERVNIMSYHIKGIYPRITASDKLFQSASFQNGPCTRDANSVMLHCIIKLISALYYHQILLKHT
ncbi:hypothetical protein M758_5G142200 [Ceratodon purpureus]|nr:hypothetical protein M758_5G142200 [Ceratodon purpureus]